MALEQQKWQPDKLPLQDGIHGILNCLLQCRAELQKAQEMDITLAMHSINSAPSILAFSESHTRLLEPSPRSQGNNGTFFPIADSIHHLLALMMMLLLLTVLLLSHRVAILY